MARNNHAKFTFNTTSTSYRFPLLFWCPWNLLPLYNSDWAKPGCFVPGGRGFRATFPGISRDVSSNGSLLNLQTPAFGTMGNNSIAKLVPSLWLAVTTWAYGVKCKKGKKKHWVFRHLKKYWFYPTIWYAFLTWRRSDLPAGTNVNRISGVWVDTN